VHATSRAFKSFGGAQSLLKSFQFASQAVVGLLGSLCITSCANQLSLLGLDAQHVASVIFDQTSVLVLEFLDLRHELATFLSHLVNLAGESVVGSSKFLNLGSFHSSETTGWWWRSWFDWR
jgi:hypothetical protein